MSAQERVSELERIRHELTLPCQSTFIRSDVEWLLAEVARLEQERDEARNERDARRERKLLAAILAICDLAEKGRG